MRSHQPLRIQEKCTRRTFRDNVTARSNGSDVAPGAGRSSPIPMQHHCHTVPPRRADVRHECGRVQRLPLLTCALYLTPCPPQFGEESGLIAVGVIWPRQLLEVASGGNAPAGGDLVMLKPKQTPRPPGFNANPIIHWRQTTGNQNPIASDHTTVLQFQSKFLETLLVQLKYRRSQRQDTANGRKNRAKSLATDESRCGGHPLILGLQL